MAARAIPRMSLYLPAPPGHMFTADALDAMVGRVLPLDVRLTARAIEVQTSPHWVEVVGVEVDEDGKGATITIEEARHG